MKCTEWNEWYGKRYELHECLEWEIYAWIGIVLYLYVCGSVSICDNDVLFTERRLTHHSVRLFTGFTALHWTQARRLDPQVPHPPHRQHVHCLCFVYLIMELVAHIFIWMWYSHEMFYEIVYEHVYIEGRAYGSRLWVKGMIDIQGYMIMYTSMYLQSDMRNVSQMFDMLWKKIYPLLQ